MAISPISMQISGFFVSAISFSFDSDADDWEVIKAKLAAYGVSSTGSYEGDKALLESIEQEIKMAQLAVLDSSPTIREEAKEVLKKYNVEPDYEYDESKDKATLEKQQKDAQEMTGSTQLAELNKAFLL